MLSKIKKAGVCAAVSLFLFGTNLTHATAPAPIIPPEPPAPSLPPVFEKIAFCESRNRQYDAQGKPLVGITGDIGKYQINPIHLPNARRLGHDIYTEAGNTAYARWLYEHSGTQPWSASRHCWGRL